MTITAALKTGKSGCDKPCKLTKSHQRFENAVISLNLFVKKGTHFAPVVCILHHFKKCL